MSRDESASSEGAGREAGSLPLGVRARARRLYRARRQHLMEVPVAALRRRYGAEVEYDDQYHLTATVELDDLTIQVAFAGKYRMFGALIDTQWVGSTGIVGSDSQEIRYRFEKKSFQHKSGEDTGLAGMLTSDRTARLVDKSELKELRVFDDEIHRRVVVTPLPGTITAVYFPPLPPFTVPLKASEAENHIDLVLYLLRS